MPQWLIFDNFKGNEIYDSKGSFYNDWNSFNYESFTRELSMIDWKDCLLLHEKNTDKSLKFFAKISEMVDKFLPLKKL